MYQRTCAMCHDHGEALRAPTLATLKGMRYQQIYFALTVGKMQAQGQALSGRGAFRTHRFSHRPGAGERCLDRPDALHGRSGARST